MLMASGEDVSEDIKEDKSEDIGKDKREDNGKAVG